MLLDAASGAGVQGEDIMVAEPMESAGLILSLVIGALGAGLFIYGKKQQRLPQLIGGLALSLYPYFIPNLWLMAGIGVAIVAGVWAAVRSGY